MGAVKWDWDSEPRNRRRRELRKHEQGQYEQRLASFFAGSPSADAGDGDRALIVVGGIGTGKTTAVIQAVHESLTSGLKCSKCERHDPDTPHEPRVLLIDLRHLFEIPDDDALAGDGSGDSALAEASLGEFWEHTAAYFRTLLTKLEAPEPALDFLLWARDQQRLLGLCRPVQRFFTSYAPYLEAASKGEGQGVWEPKDVYGFVASGRDELIRNLNGQELTWFNVFLFKFMTEQRVCPCNVAILDNIDHAKPQVQVAAVRMIWNLADILQARVLICIRPLTWKRSVEGAVLISTESHCSPHLSSVLQSRWDAFVRAAEPAPEVVARVGYLMSVLTGGGILGRLIPATAGLSVRWAIRNFLNFLESPIVEDLPLGKGQPQGLRVSQIARAFFFGTRNHFIPQAFASLYSLGGSIRADSMLLKPRILDLLYRCFQGVIELRELVSLCQLFGYSDYLIGKALGDLLLRTRPLLWSEEDYRVRRLDSAARLMLTPIGEAYYETFFGEVLYDEAVLATDLTSVVSPEAVYEFHKRLSDRDREEILFFSQHHGRVLYGRFYPPDNLGLSVIHAKKLVRQLERRDPIGVHFYDPERAAWLSSRIEKLLAGEDEGGWA